MTLRFLLGWVIRVLLMVAASAVGFAIFVARIASVTSAQTSAPSGTVLTPSLQRFAAVEGQMFHPCDDRPYFFDPEAGRWFLGLPKSDVVLMFPHCSPWRDERGRLQLIGGWRSRRDSLRGSNGPESGLARYVFPGGQILDRVTCDPLLAGTPCWYPGTLTRILYPAHDGALYQFSFADEAAVGPARRPSRRPRRLTWRCAPPGNGEVRIVDPVWPTDPRFGGRLLVALSYGDRSGDRGRVAAKQIWWLRLSPDGNGIEAAGRLTVPEGAGYTEATPSERLPSVWAGPDGIVLAFLTHIHNETGPHLRVAPVVFDPATKSPRVFLATASVLAENRMTVLPVFSSDGRWVLSARFEADPRNPVDRFPVSDVIVRAQCHSAGE